MKQNKINKEYEMEQVINVLKSKSDIVNQVMLENVINRINLNDYEYNIICRDNIYRIIMIFFFGRMGGACPHSWRGPPPRGRVANRGIHGRGQP